MFIWIRFRIILSLAVINICSNCPFYCLHGNPSAATLCLSPSLSVSLLLSSLPTLFRCVLNHVIFLEKVSLNKQIPLNAVLIYTGSQPIQNEY
jgi:hypothetical protein